MVVSDDTDFTVASSNTSSVLPHHADHFKIRPTDPKFLSHTSY